MELLSVEINVNNVSHDTCVPLKKVDGEDNGVYRVWEITQDLVGMGGDGSIWRVNKTLSSDPSLDDTNYIAKIVRFEKIPKHIFLRNIRIQNEIASSTGFTFPIVDHWVCDKNNMVIPTSSLGQDNDRSSLVGVMIMPELTANLYNFIMNNPLSMEQTIMLLDATRNMTNELHTAGYYHGDLRLENVMVLYDDTNFFDNDVNILEQLNIYFIDFTRSGRLSQPRKDPLTKKEVPPQYFIRRDFQDLDYDIKSILRDKFNVSEV